MKSPKVESRQKDALCKATLPGLSRIFDCDVSTFAGKRHLVYGYESTFAYPLIKLIYHV